MPPYAQALFVALALAYAVTPACRWLAVKLGIMARPGTRTVHDAPKPYLGGVALYVAFAAAALLFAAQGAPDAAAEAAGAAAASEAAAAGAAGATGGLTSAQRSLLGILIGGLLMMLLGTIDDIWDLRPIVKLAGQAVAASVAIWGGVTIEYVRNPIGGLLYLTEPLIEIGTFAVTPGDLLALVWIVSMSNVLNLIDGLDGLAAGISSVAALTFLLIAWQQDAVMYVLVLAAALAGASLGFLPHNFNPARIFMGDGGALFLGYLLGTVAIEGAMKSAAALAVVVPMLAVGVPIADTLFAIIRRKLGGQPIGQADKGHLHHRLMQLGLTHRDTVLVLWAISGWLAISAIAMNNLRAVPAGIVFIFVVTSLIFGAQKVGLLSVRGQQRDAQPEESR